MLAWIGYAVVLSAACMKGYSRSRSRGMLPQCLAKLQWQLDVDALPLWRLVYLVAAAGKDKRLLQFKPAYSSLSLRRFTSCRVCGMCNRKVHASH
ncbi:hypothetical protein ACLKA7_009721 [Drosophila subpalustris]